MLIRNETLATTTGRGALGLLAGAATGAGLNAAWAVLSDGSFGEPLQALGAILAIFLLVGLFWLVAAFTLGAAGWALLHAARIRGPLAAVLYGGVLAGGFIRLFTAQSMIWGLYAVAGGAAGLVVWAVSYRPVRQVPVELFGEAGA